MLYSDKLASELKSKLQDVVVKVDEDKDWAFDVIATTEDSDRDNETIKVNGWDIKNREKNPVVLANHTYTIENIIWKWTKFYTADWVKRLKGTFSKSNPLWVLARDLYNEGMLKSVSVGFIPLKRNEQDYKIIEKAELLEVSFVAVPCNPNAISMDWKLFEEGIAKWFLVKEEIKSLSVEDTIENKLKGLIKTENNITEDIQEWIYIVWIFNSEFIFNHYSYSEANRFDKYYRRGYENKDWAIELVWENIEVQPQTERVDRKNDDVMRNDIQEIKSLLKSLTDDKVNKEEIEKQENEAKAKKELLQEINKATASALEKIKKL